MVEDVVRELGHLSLGTRLKRIGEMLQAQTQEVLAARGFELVPLSKVVRRTDPLVAGADGDAAGIGLFMVAKGAVIGKVTGHAALP